jgi:ketosteroid isomerase-like protein
VSQENVEIVRRFLRAYNDEQLDTVAETIFDAAVEWRASDVFGVLHGREAVVAHLNDLAASFDHPEITATDLLDVGDHVIGTIQGSLMGRTTGAGVDLRFAAVFSLHANRMVLVREFETRAEALKAVGLEE